MAPWTCGAGRTRRAAPQRPEADADQRGADDPFTPRRNRFDRRQQIAQQHRQGGDDDDAGGVADAPGPAGEPAAAAAVDGERPDRGQVIGAGEHVKESGQCAGQSVSTSNPNPIAITNHKSSVLFWRHSYRAVEADDFAVQHFVLEDVPDERGVLLRPSQPRRERHLLRERLARGLGQSGEQRRVERPGAIAITRTPMRANSRAIGSVMPTMPPFEAE